MWFEFTFLPAIPQWDTLKSNLSEHRLEYGLSRKTSSGRLFVALPSLERGYRSGTKTTVGNRHINQMGRQTGKGLDESDVCREQNPLV